MAKPSTKPLHGPQLYRMSADANVSPPTFLRRLAGEKVTENNRRAIDAVLRAEGLGHMIPAEAPTRTTAPAATTESVRAA